MALGFRMGLGGGGTTSKNLLPPINSLPLIPPSNTATAGTTKRTFSKDSYNAGLGADNSYVPSQVTNVSLTASTLSLTTGNGSAGVGIVLNRVEAGKTYKLDFEKTSASGATNVKTLYYKADGTFTGGVDLVANGGVFTIPSDTEFVVVRFAGSSNINTTYTLNSLKQHLN